MKKISPLLLGSTDFGNVTFVVPGIHPYFYIGSDALNHTEQYTEAAGEWKWKQLTLIVELQKKLTNVEFLGLCLRLYVYG